MLRVLSLTAAIAAFAASANAAEITVNLTGKSNAEADALIVKAAEQVCREDLADSTGYYLLDGCVRDTVAATWAKLGATPIASIQTPSVLRVAGR